MNIIINAWQTFGEFNQTGLAGLFTYPANTWTGFIPFILFALFSITLFSTFFGQKRATGRGDFFSSFAAASFFTVMVAFIMTLTEGLINIETLVITIGVAVLSVIILFASRDR